MSETRIPEALALLREKGWGKGQQVSDDGRHCIVGALVAVYGLGALNESAAHWFEYRSDYEAVRYVVLHQHDLEVLTFNDDPATTWADVEFVMEKAILERGGAL